MLKVCVDVDYRDDHALAALLTFRAWPDNSPVEQFTERIADIEPYVPGAFYRRELPCLRAVLARVVDPIELVVVDGYVWLGDQTRPGLGAHLHEALGGHIPVVGVAKTRFLSATLAIPVLRGTNATRPLYVTAIGIDVNEAARQVQSMHGPYRIPTLLRQVDALCRGRGEKNDRQRREE